MAGFIRAFPPRLLFPRPVITEIALQPFSETTKKAIFFPTPLKSQRGTFAKHDLTSMVI